MRKRKATANSQLFYRSFELRAAEFDEKSGTVPVTFSSEAPVQRWMGAEYLLHDKESVDLGRLRTMGSALFNHDRDKIIGPVTEPNIGPDRRGHALIGFDDTEDGRTARTRVKAKSLRGVSVGYQILKARIVEKDEVYEHPVIGRIDGPAFIALRWEPIEISLTPVPADGTVGVGRDATRSLDGIEIELVSPPPKEEEVMDKRMREYLESRGLDAKATEEQAWEFLKGLPKDDQRMVPKPEPKPEEKPAQGGVPSASGRMTRKLYDQAVAAGELELAVRLHAAEGKSDAEITDAILAAVAIKRGAPAGPGKPEDKKGLAGMSDAELAGAINAPALMSFKD